jgi:tetratricopeptide (TPR) repeat protein
MKLFFFLALVIPQLNFAQQNKLQGVVFEYVEKSSNKTLPRTDITAPYSQGARSEYDGSYLLQFDNEAKIVTLTVFKQGYELINKDQGGYNTITLDISLVSHLNIYLDVEGNTEKRKKRLEDAYDSIARRNRDIYYTRIDKSPVEASKVKYELEKKTGKMFKDLDQLKFFIAEQYGANKKLIEDLIPSILQQNLDHKHQEVEKIKQFVLKGLDDSIVVIVHAINFKRRMAKTIQRNEEISNLYEEGRTEKEELELLIPVMLNEGSYDKADSAYREMILLDSTDLLSYYNYASFLQKQNRFEESQTIYNGLLQIAEKYHSDYATAIILTKLGGLVKEIQQYSKAKEFLEKALFISRNLTKQDSSKYISLTADVLLELGQLLKHTQPELAESNLEEALGIYKREEFRDQDLYLAYEGAVYEELGGLYCDNKQFNKGHRSFDEAFKIYKTLVNKDSAVYLPLLATTYNNFGILNANLNKYGLARDNYQKALKIRRGLAAKNPNSYLPEVAKLLDNMGGLYKSGQDYEIAKSNYVEAINMERDLVKKNVAAYLPLLANTLNNYGVFLNEFGKFNLANNAIEESLNSYRRLSNENPDVFQPYVATLLNNKALFWQDDKDPDSAKNEFEEALKIRREIAIKTRNSQLPDIAEILVNLGQFFSRRKLYDSAISKTEEALNIFRTLVKFSPDAYNPNLASTLNNLGLIFTGNKNFDSANKVFEEAISIDRQLVLGDEDAFLPNLASVLNNIGINAIETRDFSAAQAYFDEALKYYKQLAVKNPDIYNIMKGKVLENVCKLLIQQNHIKEQIPVYEELLEIYEGCALKQPDRCLNTAININYKMGVTYMLMDVASGKSIRYFSRAKTITRELFMKDTAKYNKNIKVIDPFLTLAYGNYAWTLLQQRKFDSSAINARLGLATDSTQIWIKINLGHALLLKGKYNEALSLYMAAKDNSDPNNKPKLFKDTILEDLSKLEEENIIPTERRKDVLKIKELLQKKN